MPNVLRSGLPSAGVFAGPVAWIIGLEARYSAVPWVCAHKVQLIHPITLVAAVIGLCGAFLSWRGLSPASAEPPADASGGGRPHHFTAALGIVVSLLFTAVILVQGAAAFFLDGCER